MTTWLNYIEWDIEIKIMPDWDIMKSAMAVWFDHMLANRDDEVSSDGHWFKNSCLFKKDNTGNYIMERSDIFEAFWKFLQPFLQKIISGEIDSSISVPFEEIHFSKNGKNYLMDVALYMIDSAKAWQHSFAVASKLWATIPENERAKFPDNLSFMISEWGCQAWRGRTTLKIWFLKNTQWVVDWNAATVNAIL